MVIGECDLDKHGTFITFSPDRIIFDNILCNYDILKEQFRKTAYLTKNLAIDLLDDRDGSHH